MAGGGDIFRGLRFKLIGFEEDVEDEFREQIRKRGGHIENLHMSQGLYFVLSSTTERYSDPGCVQARENRSVAVNEFWLQDSIEAGALADINDVLYRPPVSFSGMKGTRDVRIAHLGFPPVESRRIKRLVEIIGAQNVNISDSAYLICNTVEDYEEAKSKKLFTVNKKWLEDCVTKWEVLSIDDYVKWPKKEKSTIPKKYSTRNYRTPSKDKSAMDCERGTRNYGTPTKDKSAMNCEREASPAGSKGKTHLGETSRKSPERKSSKRQAVSTGGKRVLPGEEEHAIFCRRSLNFDWKQFSEFDAKEMVVTVQIPRSRAEMVIGSDGIKGALLGAFTSVSNYHSGGECIKNAITAERFRISTNSAQVILEHPQLVDYDESLALANRRQFVQMVEDIFKDKGCTIPKDICGWISCILETEKVPDRVLRRHVNMLHPIDIHANFVSMFSIVLTLRTEDFSKYTVIAQSELMMKYGSWKLRKFRWKLLIDALTYIHPNLRSQLINSGASVKPKERADDFFGIVEVVRDCFTHPALVYHNILLPVLLADNYPTLLSDLQRALSKFGHLKNLR